MLLLFRNVGGKGLHRSIATKVGKCIPSTYNESAVSMLGSRTMFSGPTVRLMNDDLPYHIVVGMPALSPTMESGALSEWFVKEGDGFAAGDALAKIETDKATIDFEAQDDGFVAKLLAEEGGGTDIPVGNPIMITVEEEDDVGAFADYVHTAEAAAPPPAVAEPKEEPAAASAPPTPPPAAAAPPPPPPPPPKPVEEAPSAPEPVVAAAAVSAAPLSPQPKWGVMAKVNSPIAKTLSKQQQAYLENYGTTGQLPL